MGIANIINTAGGGGGGGSEIITNLVNSVDGAGLRLANQGYISCADVSANRFGTNDFSVEFVLSQETNAINADIFTSNLNGSNQAVDAAVIRWDVIQNDNIQLVFTNSGATETAYNFGYDPAPDLNEPTHYLVSADRSGNAVLYRNGAEIASVSIAASGSANVGNSGQPTVIGSPVNNFGVKGNVYRFRTYSKALSSDEAKNVFDRADVPTALVSNLLLDLDCAYANPTQSTVIQDRGPNNQDGTLNGTITQTNVIKQLNSTSARIGTTAATPADGELSVSGELKTGSGSSAPSSSSPYAYLNGLRISGGDASNTIYNAHGNIGITTPNGGLSISSSTGNATFSKDIIVDSGTTDVAATFKSSDPRAWVQFRDDSTTDTAVMVGAEGDDLKLRAGSNTRVTITSTGQVGVGKSPDTTFEVAASSAHARITGNSGTSPELQLSSAGAVNWKLRSNVSSSDFRITKDSTDYLTINSTGLATFSGGIKNEQGIYGGQITIADDAVGTITPPRQGVMMAISYGNDQNYPTHESFVGIVWCDTGASQNVTKLTSAGAAISVFSGVDLSAAGETSSVDGHVNISTISGTIQIKNRIGSGPTWWYNFIA